jgi:hypothetical protein
VDVRIFNVMGQEVASLVHGILAAGRHVAVWSGKDRAGVQLASGVYMYNYEAVPLEGGSGFQTTKRMLLLSGTAPLQFGSI